MAQAHARVERDERLEQDPRPRPELRLVEPPPENAGRRTVQITGRPDPAPRRRSRTEARIVARPDRVGMWAVLLGLFMTLMAVATARADTIV